MKTKAIKTSHWMLWSNHYRTVENWLYGTSKHIRIDFIKNLIKENTIGKGRNMETIEIYMTASEIENGI